MNICVNYGKDEKITIDINRENLIGIFEPNEVDKFNEITLIKEALNKTLNQKSFDDFIDTKEKIVIIVNDGTRPTPTAKVLSQIYPKIKDKNKVFSKFSQKSSLKFIDNRGYKTSPSCLVVKKCNIILSDLWFIWV